MYLPALAEVVLTPSEEAWLRSNGGRVVVGYDWKFPPVEFLGDRGLHRGMSADIIALIEKRLGVTFERRAYMDWSRLLNDLRTGQPVIASALARTPARSGYTLFTEPYVDLPVVLVTVTDVAEAALEDFAGKRVTVVDGYSSEEYLRAHHADKLTVVEVESVPEGLRDVAFGVSDAMVVNLGAAAWYIRNEGLPNLHVAGDVPLRYPLSLGVSKVHPELHSIISKGLDDIPAEQLHEVVEKWTTLAKVPWYADTVFLRIVKWVALALVLALAVGVTSHLLLRRKLSRHMQELVRQQELNRSLVENAPVGIFRSVPEGRFLSVNDTMAHMFGYDDALDMVESITDLATQLYAVPEERRQMLRELERSERVQSFELVLLRKDGARIWVTLSLRRLVDPRGRVVFEGFCQDVTARRHAEEAMRESEQLFRTIFNQSYQLFGLLDVDGVVLMINNAALAMAGVRLEEVVGRRFADTPWWRDRPVSRQRLQQDIEDCARGGQIRRQVRLTDLHGESRIVDFSLTPFRDEEGRVVYLIPEGRDITEMVRVQEALKESQRRLEIALDAARAGIYEIIPDTGEVFATEGVYDMLGRDPAEPIESLAAWAEWVHPGDRATLLKLARQYTEPSSANGPLHVECRMRMEDGGWLWVTSMALPTAWDERGGVTRIVGIMLDVDQAKKAEERLKVSEATYREIFNATTDAIMVLEPEAYTCVDVNEAFYRIYGYARDEVLHKGPEAGFRKGTETKSLRMLLEQAAYGETVRYEAREQNRDGDYIWTDNVAREVTLNERPYVLLVSRDVSERKRMEEVMIQTEKMMSVGGLAAGMAHEINNPLSIILQAAQNVERRLGTELPRNKDTAERIGLELDLLQEYLEERRVFPALEAARRAGERAAQIVRNMLSFSRKSDSKLTPVDLGDLIEKTLQLANNDYDLKKEYDFRRIRIKKEIAPALPRTPCAPTELQQVLLNLLRNSAQALAQSSRDNPAIAVRAYIGGDDMATLEVEDNGVGLPEDERKRVFEPFYTTKEVGVGTGLGLSISYFIITQRHNGQLDVESEPGRWTRFRIRLPLSGDDGAAQGDNS